jgi:hypothetical protein
MFVCVCVCLVDDLCQNMERCFEKKKKKKKKKHPSTHSIAEPLAGAPTRRDPAGDLRGSPLPGLRFVGAASRSGIGGGRRVDPVLLVLALVPPASSVGAGAGDVGGAETVARAGDPLSIRGLGRECAARFGDDGDTGSEWFAARGWCGEVVGTADSVEPILK